MSTDYAKFTPITEDTKFELKLDENTSCIMTGGQIRAALTPNIDLDEEQTAMEILWNYLDMRITHAEMDALKPHILAAMQDYAKWFYNKNIQSVEPKSDEECLRTLYENVKDERMKEFLGIWFEEHEKVGDPAEEEKFFAKIFPKEDNDPIS